MERDVLYLKIPDFPVAVERLRDASLRGRPVAVCAAGPGPGRLQAISAEAREAGLFRGMPRQQARRSCPGLRILPPDPALYQRAGASLFRLLSDRAPLVEPARPGALYLDLSGTRRLFGPARDRAWQIRKEVRERLGLSACLGMASNKLMSRIAVKAAPSSVLCDVFPGGERHFLEPLEVRVLPSARPDPAAERLRELNIERVTHLLAVPLPALRLAFGRSGPALFRQARGLDASPVRPPPRTLRITEEETLPGESNEDALVLFVLQGLAEEAGRRLRLLQAAAGRMEVEARYADGATARRAGRMHPPACLDRDLFHTAQDLLEQAVRRRVRLRGIALHCLEIRGPSGPGGLFPEEDLLSPADRNRRALQQAVDSIRGRFGNEAVRWGGPGTAPRKT